MIVSAIETSSISHSTFVYESADDSSLDVSVIGDDGGTAAANQQIPLLDGEQGVVMGLVSEMISVASDLDEAPRMSRLGGPLNLHLGDEVRGALWSANKPGNDSVSIAYGDGLCLLGHEAAVRAIFEGIGAFRSELRVWKSENHISKILISMQSGAYDAWVRAVGKREGWPLATFAEKIAAKSRRIEVHYAGPKEINMLALARFREWQRDGLQMRVRWHDEDTGARYHMTGRIAEAHETFDSHFDLYDGHIRIVLSDGATEQSFYVWQVDSLELFTEKQGER